MKLNGKFKKAYNLALSIYSHVRHEDYVGAKHLASELLNILDELTKETKHD
jgi:hypothetical protein